MRRLLACLVLLASSCFAQTADDNIVLVGNQAQPVQWTHQNSIQAAILRAGPKGVVWIPGTYAGTDCNPLSSCNPGTTLIVDLRGGTFQTYPVLSGGTLLASPLVTPGGVQIPTYLSVGLNGQVGQGSSIYFVPDATGLCGYYALSFPGAGSDLLCDDGTQLNYNPYGATMGNQWVMTQARYAGNPVPGLVPVMQANGMYQAGAPMLYALYQPQTFASLLTCSSSLTGMTAMVSDSTTVTWGATVTGGGTSKALALCDGTNWTVVGK